MSTSATTVAVSGWASLLSGGGYDENNNCRACGEHIADPHAPGCPADPEPADPVTSVACGAPVDGALIAAGAQRADLAASHRLGHRQRTAVGEYFYTHPNIPDRAFPSRRAAVDAAGAVESATGDGNSRAPMYGAPVDWYTPQLDSDPDAGLSITHTHEDGTRFDGGRKGDGTYEILRGCGFTWRRGAGVHIAGSRDRFADLGRIDRAAAALRAAGHLVAVEVDDVWRPAEAREEHRAERVAYRAARLAERASRQEAAGDARRAAEQKIGDSMPFGEPIKEDHYSAPRHRRAFERMDAHRRAAYEAYDYAESLANRATGASRNEAAKHNPRAIMCRVERMEAEARRWERELADLDAADGGRDAAPRHARRCVLHLEQLREDIAYQRAKLAALGESGEFVAWGPEHFRKGDWANVAGRWCEVDRVNVKSLSVHGRFDWSHRPERVPWDEIHGRRRDGMQWDTPNGQPWPVEDARRVAKWVDLDKSAQVTGVPPDQRRRVEATRRIVRGLPTTATEAEVEAFPGQETTEGRRAAALLAWDVYERLAAGERAADVADAVAGRVTELAGTPAWRMPDGPTVDKLPRDLVPGDVVAGVWDNSFGMRRLHPGIVGPVTAPPRHYDRRESGEWYTVTLATGTHEVRSHRWFAVHPAGGGGGSELGPTPAPEPGPAVDSLPQAVETAAVAQPGKLLQCPAITTGGPVPVADLNRGDRVHVYGMDQFGQPIAGAGYVSDRPTEATVRSRPGRRRRPVLVVGVSEYADGANGWRMTVHTTPDATAEPVTDAEHQFRPGVVRDWALTQPRCLCGWRGDGEAPLAAARAAWQAHADVASVPGVDAEPLRQPGRTVTAETVAWCAARGHPWVTYNPQTRRSYCRCGARQGAGQAAMDWAAKREMGVTPAERSSANPSGGVR